jgi:hypothetical protein
MNPLATITLSAVLGIVTGTARGELKIVPPAESVRVFAGAARTFPVVWQNTGDATATADLRMHLLQTTSSTAIHVGDWPWKKIQVLAGQPVLEHATLDFPDVRAETRFLIKWIEGTNHFWGITEVMVYPTNLLTDLKPLAGEDQPVGVFDPGNVLKPLLKVVGVEFEDMEDSGIGSFRGQLAIFGPFESREQMPGDLTERIEKLARTGTGIVWLQPPPGSHDKLQPSFRTVLIGETAVVVVQPQLVANLADNPQAQLNLVHLCRLAREPEPPRLPVHGAQQ